MKIINPGEDQPDPIVNYFIEHWLNQLGMSSLKHMWSKSLSTFGYSTLTWHFCIYFASLTQFQSQMSAVLILLIFLRCYKNKKTNRHTIIKEQQSSNIKPAINSKQAIPWLVPICGNPKPISSPWPRSIRDGGLHKSHEVRDPSEVRPSV